MSGTFGCVPKEVGDTYGGKVLKRGQGKPRGVFVSMGYFQKNEPFEEWGTCNSPMFSSFNLLSRSSFKYYFQRLEEKGGVKRRYARRNFRSAFTGRCSCLQEHYKL